MPEIKSDKRCPIKKAIGEKLRSLKAQGPEVLLQALIEMDMTEEEAVALAHDPCVWSRDEQHIDLSQEATTIAVIAGRGLVY